VIDNMLRAEELKAPPQADSLRAPRESAHYKGIAGSKYFDWQNKNAVFAARIEARKFGSYVRPTDAVLDFGCGGGHILRNLACARRVGVDVNPAARAAALRAGVDCRESLHDVEDGAFNVVISNHALEHVEYPIAVLRALRNKLLPSGRLVLYVPIDDWRKQKAWNAQDVNHHLHTWTPQTLGNSLIESGFGPDQFSIHVVTHALFPGTMATFGKIPELVFDKFCQVFSVLVKRRQLLVVARKN